MQNPAAKAERKKEKKISNIMWRSIGAAGIGLGLLIMKLLVAPFIGDNPAIENAITTFSLALIGFGGLMIVLFIFKKKWLPSAYLLMLWLVLPAILLKLLAGVF